MKLQSVEGTYDILPGDPFPVRRLESWHAAEETIRAVMQRFAFKEIRTPTLERLALIARGVGEETDIVTKQMFSFVRGSTHYALRPEMTAPVMRAYLQHHLNQRAGDTRLYYMGPCFRAERPQKGRYRQFHQFGAEVLGVAAPCADAEVIACMAEVYYAVGLTHTTLRINTLGDVYSRARYKEALKAYFKPLQQELSATSQQRLQTNPLRILDTKLDHERVLLEDAPRLTDYVDDDSRKHFKEVKSLLTAIGVAFVEDPFLVRGLDYYMRTAFELESVDIGAQSALAGGGRYDLLSVAIGSKKPVPAVGFAAGMERLLLALDMAGTSRPRAPIPDVYLIGLGGRAARVVFRLAFEARRAGLHAVYDMQNRSLRAQMRRAHRAKARHCAIVGDRELDDKQAQIKDMAQGTQESVSFCDLPHYLLSHRS